MTQMCSLISLKVKEIMRAGELVFPSFRHSGFTEPADVNLSDAEIFGLSYRSVRYRRITARTDGGSSGFASIRLIVLADNRPSLCLF